MDALPPDSPVAAVIAVVDTVPRAGTTTSRHHVGSRASLGVVSNGQGTPASSASADQWRACGV
jgi:hypothetical protein